MKRAILACVLAIICLSLPSYAGMQCSIEDTITCENDPNREVIFTISDLADGGSHAMYYQDEYGNEAEGYFPKSVCCGGVAGLKAFVETSAPSPTTYDFEIGFFADGHFSRTGTYTTFKRGLYLDAPTDIDCQYSTEECNTAGYDTCLFTISEDSPGYSHVSGCGDTEYPFDNANDYRYCCSSGTATCSITDIYWGLLNEADELEEMSGSGPIGGEQDIFLIVETANCLPGTQVNFGIDKDPAGTFTFKTYPDMDLGTFEGEPLGAEYSNVAVAYWETPAIDGDYIFKATVHKDEVVREDDSPIVNVDGDVCQAIDPTPYCPSMTDEEKALCASQCVLGGEYPCPDNDCDEVANCIDRFEGTVVDPELVDKCTGVVRGTAGCVPKMDCTNLLWSECKNCEAGQECNTVGGFDAGTMYMERCETGDCLCKWNTEGGVTPTGCTDALLDQSDNRFKECIEDEEFPFFDGFNVIAVLLVLSLYYAIIIVRKKK
ncbi:MAG: hypothetical protein PHO02_04740 [Candidatus Nanoarchaeia archaeon]|nr:hypothetical protein [Candidatus Nanoarchaeia archaeon]